MTFFPDECDNNTPLPPGHYYVLPVDDIVQSYLQCNPAYRRPEVLWREEETDMSILDAELTTLLPYLMEYSSVEDCLHDYCTHLREDAFDHLDPEVADDVNGRPIVIPAVTEATLLGYTSVLHNLGMDIRDRLKEQCLYREDGSLIGDFKAICENGLLILG